MAEYDLTTRIAIISLDRHFSLSVAGVSLRKEVRVFFERAEGVGVRGCEVRPKSSGGSLRPDT